MIFCKKCGFEVTPGTQQCPECQEKITLSGTEIITIKDEIARAKSIKNYELVYHYTEALADYGYLPAQREWACLLESGELGEVNLDKAMGYFYLAALKNDPYSAYRYSRLIGRESESVSVFWLEFSALLGCKEAYADMARLLDEQGRATDATYYYTLAARTDSVSAIVTLARRYYEGIGAVKSDAYAKWYMDKLTIPPINAIRLAYRLRTVTAKEPDESSFEGYLPLVRLLCERAEAMGFTTAQRRLTEILAEEGDAKALARLGVLYAEGIGGETRPDEAIACLNKAAAEGVSEAYKTLGMLYLSGFLVQRNAELALKYFEMAAKGGYKTAYETMADIYYRGEHVERDVEYAATLYEKAAVNGSASAREKLEKIIKMRTSLYKEALLKEKDDPREAFGLLNRAVSMGHIPAYQRLARAYLLGLGTKENARLAVALLKRAVELGDDGAVYPLGVCYLRGIGVKQSYKQARVLLEAAYKQGIEIAGEHIAAMLESKRIKLSERYYSSGIRLLYSQKSEAAMQAFEIADKLGNAKATYTLGCFFEFGLGVPCDKDRAYELYEEAFRNKFRDPRASYKLTVLKLIKNTIRKK